jgi:cysteine dioxygenase
VTDRLHNLIETLDLLQGRPPLNQLVAELVRSQIDCSDVTPFLRFSDRNYQRNLLNAGPWYQAWVLCWKNGQRSPIHNHSGSVCGLRVLRGTLTETRFEFAPNGHVKATESRDFGPGHVIGSADTDMHQVSNLQAGEAELVTLHVYSPPLEGMRTYSLYDLSRGFEVWEIEFANAAGI